MCHSFSSKHINNLNWSLNIARVWLPCWKCWWTNDSQLQYVSHTSKNWVWHNYNNFNLGWWKPKESKRRMQPNDFSYGRYGRTIFCSVDDVATNFYFLFLKISKYPLIYLQIMVQQFVMSLTQCASHKGKQDQKWKWRKQ